MDVNSPASQRIPGAPTALGLHSCVGFGDVSWGFGCSVLELMFRCFCGMGLLFWVGFGWRQCAFGVAS